MNDINAQISEKLDFFVEKFNAAKIEELVNGFFTEDCIVTGSGVPHCLVGREAAIAAFNQVRSVQEEVSFNVVETRYGTGMHHCVVQTQSRMKDGSDAFLKSFVVFRETEGGLLCEVDFFAEGRFE